jgi:hypothetical protein
LTNSEVYENLRILTKEIGPRIEGSSNLAMAIEFTKELMLKYDFDTVYLQPAMVSDWKRGDQELVKIINTQTNKSQNINCLALGNSIGTAENGITGEVIEIYGMNDLEKTNSEQIKGKIVFLNEPFDTKIINTFEDTQKISKLFIARANNMVYNALACNLTVDMNVMLSCILLIKNSAVQRQRHHTPVPFGSNLIKTRNIIEQIIMIFSSSKIDIDFHKL